jgi:hypothetical protein
MADSEGASEQNLKMKRGIYIVVFTLVVVIGGSIGISQWRQHLEREQAAIEENLRNEQKAQKLAEEAREARSEGYAGAPEAAAKLEKAVKLDPDNWRLRKRLVGYYMDMAGHFELDRGKIDKQLLKAAEIEDAPRLKLLEFLSKVGSVEGKKKAQQLLEKEFPYSMPQFKDKLRPIRQAVAMDKQNRKTLEKINELQKIVKNKEITNLPWRYYQSENAVKYELLIYEYLYNIKENKPREAYQLWESIMEFRQKHGEKHLKTVETHNGDFRRSIVGLTEMMYEAGMYEKIVKLAETYEKNKALPGWYDFRSYYFSLAQTGQKENAVSLLEQEINKLEINIKNSRKILNTKSYYQKYPSEKKSAQESLNKKQKRLEQFKNWKTRIEEGDINES